MTMYELPHKTEHVRDYEAPELPRFKTYKEAMGEAVLNEAGIAMAYVGDPVIIGGVESASLAVTFSDKIPLHVHGEDDELAVPQTEVLATYGLPELDEEGKMVRQENDTVRFRLTENGRLYVPGQPRAVRAGEGHEYVNPKAHYRKTKLAQMAFLIPMGHITGDKALGEVAE